jgi:phenylalanyl-tRNA synthetase beta chain
MGSIFRSPQKLVPAISPDLAKRPSQKIIEEIFASVPPQAYHVAGLLVGKVENENWQGKARAYCVILNGVSSAQILRLGTQDDAQN